MSPLLRHIVVVLLLKALALVGLWHAFVAPQKKAVDVRRMTERIVPGLVSHSHSRKEVIHDDRSDRR
ncbi:MAG: cytochrome oxidase putative small subunit CydP [Thiobacillaceae bacterium]